MRIRETNLDERLDLLENIEDGKGEVFLCEKKTNFVSEVIQGSVARFGTGN